VAPGSSLSTGAHRTNPARQDEQLYDVRGPLVTLAARLTAPVVSVPTAMTVTITTAGAGLTATRSRASTGAGRVSRVMIGLGVPATRSGGTASMKEQPLHHQRHERPVRGQVAQGPGDGQQQCQRSPTRRTPTDAGSAGSPRRRVARQATTRAGMATVQNGWKVPVERMVERRHRNSGRRRLCPMAGPARLDRLERVTDLVLVLLHTDQPLTLDSIAHQVPGYPEEHAARRQAFERDKRLLRDEGIPVLTQRLRDTSSTATGLIARRSTCPIWPSSPMSRCSPPGRRRRAPGRS
jgi:hypothetical protein